MNIREKFIKEKGYSYFNETVLNEYSIWLEQKFNNLSYQEALEFLQLHIPFAVKPIKKSKYTFVQPFTSRNARDIVISSLAEKLSELQTNK